MTTATDIVILCENTLGWVPNPAKPLWQARSIEAGKIKRKLRTSTVTLEDLALTVEYCWKKREPITSPMGLFHRVEAAREMANPVTVLTDISTAVQAAISWELGQVEPDTEWLGRLVRCHGEGREVVLNGWREAGRG